MSTGKVVGAGPAGMACEAEAWGTSNAILGIGSMSSISSEGKRRATWLQR